jgi:uncharacterized protein
MILKSFHHGQCYLSLSDQVHSKEFSEDAYNRAIEPKELYYVKGDGHVDLYDRIDLIPFDKLTTFFKTHLK